MIVINCRYFILLFLLLVTSFYANAKNSECDSLKIVLSKTSETNKLSILNDICFHCRFSDPQLAMSSGLDGLNRSKKNNSPNLEVYLHLNMGLLFFDQAQYESALNHFIAAEKGAERIADKRNMAAAMHNIGLVYQTQTLYEKALVNYNSALKNLKENGSESSVAAVLNSIGSIYYEMSEFEKALECFLEALKTSEELNDLAGIADGLNNAAVIYEEMKNYSKAMEYHRKSLVLSRKQSNQRAVSASLYNIALIYVSQKQYDNAINYIDSAMITAKKINAIEPLKEYYSTLSEIYYFKNDFKTALRYHTLFSDLKDTLVNQDRNKLIVEMSTKYQSEKKEKQNQILKQQNELQNLSINRQRIINYSVTLGFIMVLVLAFFIYRGYKQKKKANLQLEEKNLLIEEKNKIVEEKNKIVEEKNKDITDSIRYAKRLQTAILKPQQDLTKYFNDGFILFKPKDIVSGDFYWFEKFGNLSLFAAADCTGHGVPGAFMSIIGCNLLSQAVNEYEITQPAAILNSINKGLTKVLQQKGDADSFVTDGMDIALCSFNEEKMIVEYSGAFNPMWIIREGELIEFTADKFPVGAFVDSQVRKFNCHEIPVQKGDMVYVFSDGYADQFGGPAGKKFKYKPLQQLLLEHHDKPCAEQRIILNEALEQWMGKLEQIDDVLVIGIRI